jgi:hypothetical protein
MCYSNTPPVVVEPIAQTDVENVGYGRLRVSVWNELDNCSEAYQW